MRNLRARILTVLLGISALTFGQNTQAFSTYKPTAQHKVALEVLKASKEWIANFNKGNAKACVNGYTQNAVMNAQPFGVKKGKKEISEFWTPFIQSGASNLIYTNVQIEVANKTTAFLSANWSMNVGRGIIYQEKWVKKEGKWLLSYDNFEVLEKFKTPQENKTNPIAGHLALEEVIKASIQWIQGFNAGKGAVCGNGYSEKATMNAVPFALLNAKKDIQGFWTQLIAKGAKNLIYNNPIFTAKTANSVTLSAQWSMNIGEGKIYLEKWEKVNGEWLLTYDEFQVLKQYK
ncbi:hypothetical protein F7018_14800 [Tenacibaculum aiptasiae]|uniref:Nuclear transport factor 2 family protein n=1 Tax=Tenacibaculum aiptasiae TaxID=426481 RepID=A0A7J5AAN5_9FLAO|nr:hypothetical protein [Tenacibaculum aiptasiae]KAB1154239.1 hypothetical protein F7018_14800 [Tenacibaculum aiptasiae]